jgi:hypothetical protein
VEKIADDLNGLRDPMVVRTEELKRSVEIWAVGRNFAKTVQERVEQRHTIGSYLEQETGIPGRRIRGIMNLETKVTTLSIADKIIAAIERPDLMPEVIPNPRWSQERWVKYMEEHGCI